MDLQAVKSTLTHEKEKAYLTEEFQEYREFLILEQ
jgi:hypothetical protein